jgi:hypothetical protein
MPSVVDMQNLLTTYYHSLQVSNRELRGYVSRLGELHGSFPLPVGSHIGGIEGITVVCLHVQSGFGVEMIVVAMAIICTEPSHTLEDVRVLYHTVGPITQ